MGAICILILTETEEYYEVIIGNVKGYIQKEVEAVEQPLLMT